MYKNNKEKIFHPSSNRIKVTENFPHRQYLSLFGSRRVFYASCGVLLLSPYPPWIWYYASKSWFQRELDSRVEKPSWKTESSEIVTSLLIFRNSETLDWKNENKKTELRNSEILLNI